MEKVCAIKVLIADTVFTVFTLISNPGLATIGNRKIVANLKHDLIDVAKVKAGL